MTDKDDIIIRMNHIGFGYSRNRPVLQDINFRFRSGDRVGLIAPNGSGKTTLFHIIMGLLKPSSGELEIFGRPVKTEKDFIPVRQRIGLLFQDADDQLFSPTVLEDVAFGPINLGHSMEDALAISHQTLDRLGLKGFEDRITYKLSGGEKRLVALATVLAMAPEVLLLDEPTSGLDETTRARLTEILRELSLSLFVISHEFDFMNAVADTFYSLHQGRLVADTRVVPHVHEHCHPMGQLPHQHRDQVG